MAPKLDGFVTHIFAPIDDFYMTTEEITITVSVISGFIAVAGATATILVTLEYIQ